MSFDSYKLSVIVPVFNAERFLKTCIESLLLNKSSDFEIILIDDGSTDNSAIICDEFSARYNQITTFHQINSGVSVARNLGIQKARGEYIMFIDSDDFLDEGAVDYFISQLDKDCDCIVSGIKFFYDDGSVKAFSLSEGVFDFKNEINNYFSELFQNLVFNAVYAKAYKTAIIKNNNISFPIQFSIWEDSSFVISFFSVCGKIKLNNKVFYNYRQTGGESLVKKYHYNAIQALLFKYSKIQNFIDLLDEKNQKLFYDDILIWLMRYFRQLIYNPNFKSFAQYVKLRNKAEIKYLCKKGKVICNRKIDAVFMFLFKNNHMFLFFLLNNSIHFLNKSKLNYLNTHIIKR